MSLFVETSSASLNKQGEELCGDKVELNRGKKGTFLVLADGLGSGVKANILASLTSKIVITMLLEDAHISDIVDTMSATLPVCKVRQVAYSTFTFVHIEPNGHARIVEYDNPDTIVLRNGKSLSLDRTIREIDGKQIREINMDFQPGDQCIVCSDGVVHAGVGKSLNLGWQHENVVKFLEKSYCKNATAHHTQSLLLAACNNLYMETPGDDTTVAVCKIRNPNAAYVMVGPPISREDDERLVKSFLERKGAKIVCGGTTSQIVSRVTGKELTTDLNYLSPAIPPIGYIEGIDLVTEGIITLGETLRLIKKYETESGDKYKLLHSRHDGAAKLARYLIEKCTSVTFIVGRALNPAHKKSKISIDLNLKLKLVREITDCLSRLGMGVEIEYH